MCVWNQKSEKFTWNKKLCDIFVCETKKNYQKSQKFVTFETKN